MFLMELLHGVSLVARFKILQERAEETPRPDRAGQRAIGLLLLSM